MNDGRAWSRCCGGRLGEEERDERGADIGLSSCCRVWRKWAANLDNPIPGLSPWRDDDGHSVGGGVAGQGE